MFYLNTDHSPFIKLFETEGQLAICKLCGKPFNILIITGPNHPPVDNDGIVIGRQCANCPGWWDEFE